MVVIKVHLTVSRTGTVYKHLYIQSEQIFGDSLGDTRQINRQMGVSGGSSLGGVVMKSGGAHHGRYNNKLIILSPFLLKVSLIRVKSEDFNPQFYQHITSHR